MPSRYSRPYGQQWEVVFMKQPSPTQGYVVTQPSPSQQYVVTQPSSSQQYVVTEPSTSQQYVVAEPSTSQQYVVTQPSTSQQYVVTQPSTSQQYVVTQPSTSQQYVVTEPSTNQQYVVTQGYAPSQGLPPYYSYGHAPVVDCGMVPEKRGRRRAQRDEINRKIRKDQEELALGVCGGLLCGLLVG